MANLLSGFAWNMAANAAVRAAAFGAQIVLGTVLSKQDYAVYGVALSLAALVSALSNGGTQQILIQRWREYERLAPIIHYIALLFNVAAGGLLLLMGWWWATSNNLAQLNQVIALMVAASVVITPGLVMKAKLAIDQKFKALSLVSGAAGIGRHVLAMLLGLAGLGVLSFTIPALAESVLTIALAYWCVRHVPGLTRPSKSEFQQIFNDTKWQMISTFAASMALYGQFMLVGLFVDSTALGVFVFSMQLVQSVTVLIAVTIGDVLYPQLTRMHGSSNADTAFLTVFEVGFCLSLAIAALVVALADPVISLVWGGKWHDAILIVQTLTVLIATTSACVILCSILAAKGMWRDRTWLQLLYVAADIVAVALVGKSGELTAICVSLVVMRLLVTCAGACFVFLQRQERVLARVFNAQIYLLPYLALLGWVCWSRLHGMAIGNGILIGVAAALALLLLWRARHVVQHFFASVQVE